VRRILHALAGHPRVYDLVQRMAGERRLLERLEPLLSRFPGTTRILDLGGGTGRLHSITGSARYICLDSDPQKLNGFERRRGAFAVLGDAAKCPFASGSVDVIVCARVSHHLSDQQLGETLAEIARVLRTDGTLVFADALRSSRCSSRWLWSLDRGSNPRTAADIEAAIARHFEIEGTQALAIPFLHEFVICIARVRRDPTRTSRITEV
jgi:SAM-dependent methyltransferase